MVQLSLALLVLAELFFLAAFCWWLGYLWETHLNSRPGRVIYHGSNLREQGPVLEGVIRRYLGNDTASATLVEPGAGLATVSHYLARRFAWKSVEAVELGGYILLIGRLRFLFRRDGVRLVRHDLLTYPIKPGSVVYCYLFPSLITRLYEEGRLDGSLVISLTFPIQDCPPTEEIVLPSWQRRLLIYDFRKTGRKGTAAVAASLGTGSPE
jgi:hypothetical protein